MISVVVDTEGNATVAVQGVAGKACQDLTKSLEVALGKTTATERTKEYNLPPRQASHRVKQ